MITASSTSFCSCARTDFCMVTFFTKVNEMQISSPGKSRTRCKRVNVKLSLLRMIWMLAPQTVETGYVNTSTHPEWHEGSELIYDLAHVLSSFCGQVGTKHESETSSVEMGITVMAAWDLASLPGLEWIGCRSDSWALVRGSAAWNRTTSKNTLPWITHICVPGVRISLGFLFFLSLP